MRHRNNAIKIGSRNGAHKLALLRNLMTQLVLHEKIKTTEHKAKILRTQFEKFFNMIRSQSELNQVRELDSFFYSDIPGKKIKEVLIKRFENRTSGLTRLTRLYNRKGDNTTIVLIELV